MNREQMVERVSRESGSTASAVRILDAILPQVTTVAELEALPDGVSLIGIHGGGRPHVWTANSDMRRFADEYLRAYGPFVVWQPEVTA